jgi:hypothetical protein
MRNFQDLRLNSNIFQSMIGKCFKKYRCDSFTYTNTVTGIIGFFIDDKTFELKNEQQAIIYFDSYDDIAVWNIKEVSENDIHSFFENTIQIDTPVNEVINKITLLNEHQFVTISNINYELWVTRAIIFHLKTKELYFGKDNVSFSEEIEIKRGHDLLNDLPRKNDFFLNQWSENIAPHIENEFITIQ